MVKMLNTRGDMGLRTFSNEYINTGWCPISRTSLSFIKTKPNKGE